MIYAVLIIALLLSLIIWAERGLLIKPSTMAGARQSNSLGNFLYMYLYVRWTAQYIKVLRFLMPRFVQIKDPSALADSYHAKVLTPQLAKNIITINQSIPLQDLEQIIPYPTARRLVLDHPLDIVVMECPCRQSAPNPCTPSMVCMVIGKPFTDFILEHHPNSSKRLTQQEALDLLEEVHQKGWVHAAYFKEVCLDRFYVLCNCCKCCCAGLEAMNIHGIPTVASSGYLARIDKESCINCGRCERACPFDAITPAFDINAERCMGCGVCVTKCKQKAITLKLDESKGIPLDVNKLINKNN